MTATYQEIIAAASKPLKPIGTDVEPSLVEMSGVQAVLFDIYGTLLISASGDIGSSGCASRESAFADALEALGWEFNGRSTDGVEQLHDTIKAHHQRSRTTGVEYPEVDIVEVWRELCEGLKQRGQLPTVPPEADFGRLAIEYEVRVNPAWPMPDMVAALEELRQRGLVMGIISNAQFFTPLLFPAIADKTLDSLGFDPELRYYSYEHRLAKPGRELYRLAVEGLTKMKIGPAEVLYVGNDMRNDIWPAAEVGFRTALFAGDRRSLRTRRDDSACGQYGRPDAIVTNLLQITRMLDPADGKSN